MLRDISILVVMLSKYKAGGFYIFNVQVIC